ncbi:MAG: 1-deoxy-11-beta-hydroxypentalenate dehydrogenase [Stenotrophomonas maltophilia]|nr:MAG: 1-deoxy-11-beta-hydroxypentalenate dehydrogenase [Stenotrophomonas maltophilia]
MNHPAIRTNSVAVITGAATGIGYAIARQLCRAGMKVVLFDQNRAALDAALGALHDEHAAALTLAVHGDMAVDESLEALYRQACGFGEVSLLVNNAAILQGAGPWGDAAQWRRTLEVNFWGVLRLQQLFVEHLIGQDTPSAIINLGSKEGITTPPGNAAYSVSKAAVKVLTEQLAHELREATQGRVSAHLLIPGYTFTPMNFPDMRQPRPAAPWSAEQVAQRLLEGLGRGDFYIFCEDNDVSWALDQRRLQWSADDMILNRPALSRWHADYRQSFRAYVADLE